MKRHWDRWMLNGCDRFPAAKPLLRRWGLQAAQSWFNDTVVRVQTLHGKSFKLTGLAQNQLTFELFWRGAGYYEPITTLLACELARTTDAFIDAGANIGFFPLVISTCQPKLRIVAFEPDPRHFQLLHANIACNQLSNVSCEPLALSDTSGKVSLFLNPLDTTPTLKVPAVTVDDYLAWRPLPGRLLIKLDVEGHEAAVFHGAHDTISSRKPDIIFAVNRRPEALPLSFLQVLGYRFYQITDQGLLRTQAPSVVTHGELHFPNCLLSARPVYEVDDLFRRIEPHLRRLDLKQTSKSGLPRTAHRFRQLARPPAHANVM